ncbi:MAG: DUF3379 family protein [Gammaproteobacteria bacterium]|nr:DUF3379 family protein [Gammaproteobacteria bacterium]
MNCLEFRRLCLTELDSNEAEFLQHTRDCHPCAEFRHQQKRHEDSLRQAFAIVPPTGLEARILLRQSFTRTTRTRQAVAASIIVVIVTAALAWLWATPHTLEAEVLAHIHAEPEHLAATGPESPVKVASVLHALGAKLRGNLGEVRHAGICDIRRRPGVHLVLAGRLGPVTVLLLPDETVGGRAHFQRDGFQGLLIPVGNGAAAIVGLPGEPLGPIEARLPPAFTG